MLMAQDAMSPSAMQSQVSRCRLLPACCSCVMRAPLSPPISFPLLPAPSLSSSLPPRLRDLTKARCQWDAQARWGLIKVTGILEKHRNKLAALVAAME